MTNDTKTIVLDTRGLSWATEKNLVEAVLSKRPGVVGVEANPVAQSATVVFDATRTSLAELRGWVEECGLHCAGQSVPNHICDPMLEDQRHDPTTTPEGVPPHEAMGHGGHGDMSMDDMVRDMRNRFLVAAVFSVPILLWSPIGRELLGFQVGAPLGLRDDVWMLLLSLPVIFYSSFIFFDGAIRASRARTLDMMVLVAVAIGAGWAYSLGVTLTGGGEVFYEAATVLAAFVLLGHWFEMRARGGANDAIRTLLDLAPPKATIVRDGDALEVPTSEIVVGDLMLVRPGTKIATDGVVEEGTSEVDESVVTGESLPVSKEPGSRVIGATINKNGTLRVRATEVGADTALAQIVKLVQEAQNSKAPGQKLADRAAFWLVFVALIGGGATFLAWLLARGDVTQALLFAITVVVITCPDALGLATPTAIMVGTGLGARRGILFKNALALETAARIDTVVMDKTGTLTKGEPEVASIVTHGIDEGTLLRLVAAVERESEHPLADAVVAYAERLALDRTAAEHFESVPGHGATATVDKRRVVVGNKRLLEREGISFDNLGARRDELSASGHTVVAVAVDGRVAGLIAIADAPRPTSRAAVAGLRAAGAEVVMLTGDNQATATRIGAELGIDSVIAEVPPSDKSNKITELKQAGKKVAMVGDGVNDAPALARADLGIAIGAGTDVAIETADVVLMRSDPLDVATALVIGRGTLRKMRQNLGWAIGYNAIALPIAAGVFEPAFGLVLRPEIAALSMSGSSLLVATNAVLLKRLQLPAPVESLPPSPPPLSRRRSGRRSGRVTTEGRATAGAFRVTEVAHTAGARNASIQDAAGRRSTGPAKMTIMGPPAAGAGAPLSDLEEGDPMSGNEEREGVSLTHLDEPLYEDADATKRDLVDYLDTVADRIVPELADRPLSVVRVVRGQPPFMQKNVPKYTPAWVRTVPLWAEASKRQVSYALCNDRRTLLWFANQRAVEYHPTLIRADRWDHPTHLVLDIDPPLADAFPLAVRAAHLVRHALSDAGLAGAVKTSGAKGVHVFVPIEAQATIDDLAAATRAIAARAERLDPALATTAYIREDRGGKVFLDSTRAGGATVVSAYSPRIRPGVPVSFPVAWSELDRVAPADFTVHTAGRLIAERDSWAAEMPQPQQLPADLIEEGHTIPVARVQAMHEGKRRARARRR